LAGSGAQAADYSESEYSANPVLRPLTLPKGMLSLGGGLSYVEKENGSDDWNTFPWVRYGITDNLSVGLDGLTYRFLAKDGFELAGNVGLRGGDYDSKDSDDNDDDTWEVAASASLFGKKVLSDQLALTFGAEYIRWDSDGDRVNRHEWDYGVGVLYQFAPDWTFDASYTYRDLSNQYNADNANVYRVGLTRSFGNDFEVSLFYRHNDFQQGTGDQNYGYNYRNISGVAATWRF
jgi:opacity protein-like surface antigen